MLKLQRFLRLLALAAILPAVPAMAQDKRQVVTQQACSVEILKGAGKPLGSLEITELAGTKVARLEAEGDHTDLDGQKYYNFTFSRKSAMVFQGYDFWLKFTPENGHSYQCHIISKVLGDKIAVSDGSWMGRMGEVKVQTDPGQTLLTIKFN